MSEHDNLPKARRETTDTPLRPLLIGGVLPLTFEPGTTWSKLQFKGNETVTLYGLGETLRPRQKMEMLVNYDDGRTITVPLLCRIATLNELEYFNNGGILSYVLRQLAAA